jgi:chaperonin GroEL (HSP60 family)
VLESDIRIETFEFIRMNPLEEELDEMEVRTHNVDAITEVTETVRTTLGPLGMDKMLIDANGDVVVTNNSGTILQELAIEEPIANIVRNVSDEQVKKCGDGTTTAIILTGRLLTAALSLIEDGIHPMTVADGFNDANQEVKRKMVSMAVPIDITDTDSMLHVARNALNGRETGLLSEQRLANIAVEAVKGVTQDRHVDLDAIKIDKTVGGTGLATHVHEGALVTEESAHTSMPTSISNATILLVNGDLKPPTEEKAEEWTMSVSSMDQIEQFETDAVSRAVATAERIDRLGVDAIFHVNTSDDRLIQQLADRDIFVAKVSRPKLRFLKKVLEGRMVPDLKRATAEDLCRGDLRLIEGESWVRVSGDDSQGVTISIRGSVETLTDELHSSITDAADAVGTAIDDGYVLPGGGATEAELAAHLRSHSTEVADKRQLVIEEYATVLEEIPRQLARSAGLDEIDMITKLRAEHAAGNENVGIDLVERTTADMIKQNVLETVSIKATAIDLATEASSIVIRVDGMVPAARSQIRTGDNEEQVLEQ